MAMKDYHNKRCYRRRVWLLVVVASWCADLSEWLYRMAQKRP